MLNQNKKTLHIIESQQFTTKFIFELFKSADNLENTKDDCMRGQIMASLFYEPSTRTRFSFESAMLKLGGSIITTENANEFSSAIKGETLEDSIRVINNYVDIIVLRHPEKKSSERASEVSSIPIINAGDGEGQHPTQALLDIYTIYREVGKLDNLKIAIAGDLKYGRTVRSLAYLLAKFTNNKIYFISPEYFRPEDDIKKYLKKHKTEFIEEDSFENCIGEIDVLYQTRIQKERIKKSDNPNTKKVPIINKALAQKMKKGAVILHPLPRVNEIDQEVDILSQAKYFKQTYYGLLIRMALLKKICK